MSTLSVSPLEILFEDAHVLAVAKPAGLLTQGIPGGEPTLEDLARAHLAREGRPTPYLGTVHRLDRPVSGVVVWAKTPKATRRLAAGFAGRSMDKVYWAVVEPGPTATPPTAGIPVLWVDWLTRSVDKASGTVRVAAADEADARRAETWAEAEPGAVTSAGLVFLRLLPLTGRTHQLRAQCSARGLPVVGDRRYGSTRPFEGGIALHARSLSFGHPTRRVPLTVVAGLPPSWGAAGVLGPT